MYRVFILVSMVILTCFSGCVSQVPEENVQDVRQYSFVASTLETNASSSIDFDLREHLEREPMILFWVSTGCYGCHDWADTFRGAIGNGTLNASSIVSIHRYADFESEQKLNDVYGTHNNSSHPSPWNIIIPKENTTVFDFNTGAVVEGISVYEAFDYPVTPTIQIVNRNGEIVWKSKEYWPSSQALDDVLQSLKQAA